MIRTSDWIVGPIVKPNLPRTRLICRKWSKPLIMASSDTSKFRSITVFCGSSLGASPRYAEAAQELGAELCRRGTALVYGGGNVGLMGEIARTVAKGSDESKVTGVIPPELEKREVSGAPIGKVIVVKDIHARKAKMAELGEAFIALPGGFGTMEELLEIVTWQQLGYHKKPVGVLNINGFYDQLLKFFDQTVEQGFVRPGARTILIDATSPAELLNKLEAYQAGQSHLELLASETRAKEGTS